ncbi:DUF926-domain-containing protein [Sistotremastrum suecicum HHB10207 ss-3]|uniref:DUF926-domain-containing protein n=1 Tax=Sistotremastrum suecicum HHB10207 ss-3 TaxID=1314776 RepID=A0A166HC45_9AGAM|nr:DUF926-domain-containing protein [Sistotremastrum suecicum HHB10207 ss-3]
MAVVHPSRLGLVPSDGIDRSASYRSDSRHVPRSDRRSRSRSPGRERNGRRASPDYSQMRSEPPPWRKEENMYPPRQHQDGHDGYYGAGRGGGGGGGSDWLDSRRVQRENSDFSIWPPSPKAPTRDLSPSGGTKTKRSRRSRTRSVSASSSSSSEDDRARRRKEKEKRRSRKDKEEKRDHRKSKRRRHHRDERDDEKDRRRSRSHSQRERSRTQEPPPVSDDEEMWVEKPATTAPAPLPPSLSQRHEVDKPSTSVNYGQDESDEEVGPQPINQPTGHQRVDERQYGGQLLRGEGSAMAAFLAEDAHARIPRRGEIGLTSDEIAQYEDVGYVMSGSRHRRMNAVRMRKENQVISAEEKRGILKLQKEERARREAILRDEFKELVQDSLKGTAPEPKAT